MGTGIDQIIYIHESHIGHFANLPVFENLGGHPEFRDDFDNYYDFNWEIYIKSIHLT